MIADFIVGSRLKDPLILMLAPGSKGNVRLNVDTKESVSKEQSMGAIRMECSLSEVILNCS